MPLPRRPARLALGAALLAGTVGCSASTPGTDVTGPGGGTPTPTDGPAHVRIAQVVSDAPKGVDVSANGTPGLTAMAFGTSYPDASGVYESVPAATRLTFTVTGASTPFYNQVPSALAANAYATAVAFGRATAAGATTATVVALSDTNLNAPTAVLVRVFNTVDYVTPGAGTPVDVYVYPQGSARPATPSVSALAWGARSAYLVEPAGALQVDVFVARAPSTGAPLFGGKVPAGAGSVRTVVLFDPPAGSTGATGAVLPLYDYQ